MDGWMDANFYCYRLLLHHVNYLFLWFCTKLAEKDKELNKNKLSNSILNSNIITKIILVAFSRNVGLMFIEKKSTIQEQFFSAKKKCNTMMLENDSSTTKNGVSKKGKPELKKMHQKEKEYKKIKNTVTWLIYSRKGMLTPQSEEF